MPSESKHESLTRSNDAQSTMNTQDPYVLGHDQLDRDGDEEEPRTGCCCLTGCWQRWHGAVRLATFNVLGGIPAIILMAIMPEVKKAYFGSDQQAALVSVLFAATVAAINTFTVAPFARLTDAVGRRPLFVATGAVTVVQFILPVIFPRNPIPYMLAQSVSGLIQTSFAWAMIVDVTAPEHRQWGYTLVSAIGMISMVFSLPVGLVHTKNEYFFMAAAATAAFQPVYAYFFIPETLAKEHRVPLTRSAVLVNPFRELYTLAHSRALIIVVVAMCISTAVDNGMKDVYLFVLNDRIGFTQSDNGIFFPVMAMSAMIGYFVVMPMVKDRLTPPKIIAMSLVATALLLLAVALAWAPWVMFVCGVFYAPLMLAYPTTQALVANSGTSEQTTARLTALSAVADVGATIGPLVFGGIFDVIPDKFNQVPFFFFALLTTGVAAVVYVLLPRALAAESTASAAPTCETALLLADGDWQSSEAGSPPGLPDPNTTNV